MVPSAMDLRPFIEHGRRRRPGEPRQNIFHPQLNLRFISIFFDRLDGVRPEYNRRLEEFILVGRLI